MKYEGLVPKVTVIDKKKSTEQVEMHERLGVHFVRLKTPAATPSKAFHLRPKNV